MNHCTCSGDGRQGCVTSFLFFVVVLAYMTSFSKICFFLLCFVSSKSHLYNLTCSSQVCLTYSWLVDDENVERIKLETALTTVLHIFHCTSINGALKNMLLAKFSPSIPWIMDYFQTQSHVCEQTSNTSLLQREHAVRSSPLKKVLLIRHACAYAVV